MKDTLIEAKNNLTVEWMKPRIKSMIWNIRKLKPSRATRRKKNPKKLG